VTENYYIDYKRALELILEAAPSLPGERVSLFNALGRILAEDVVAEEDNPQAPVSAMDGYGVNWEDLKELPARLRLTGEIPAGSLPSVEVKRGEAVKLYTGSVIPKGCTAVVPVEFTEEKDGWVTVKRPFPVGANIREKGEDYRNGEVILEKGEVITPAEMGILASANRSSVNVAAKPRVGIVTTGSEVVEPGEKVERISQVRNSNAYTLYGLVKEAGGEPIYLGICPDSREETKKRLKEALNLCDIVLTSGGISTGDYDFVKEVVKELQVEPIFYKVKVKPGKPVFFGRRGNKFLFGLPGFPVSAAVGFINFVFPFIRKSLGAKSLFKKRVKAELTRPFKRRKADRLEFARCKLSYSLNGGGYRATPIKRQGSGALSALRGNTGLMVIPPGVREVEEGSKVEVILLKEGGC